MAVMVSTLYLAKEELNLSNYPEIRGILKDVQELISYAIGVSTVMGDYISGIYDRMDINIADLQKYIVVCRSLCDVLGTSPNVCYDLLTELRLIQNSMQTLIFIKNRYGTQYIGTPTG